MRQDVLSKKARRDLKPWIGAVITGLVLAGCNQQAAGPQLPTDAPRALVLGAVNSPVYDELKKSMRVVPYDGSQKASEHDLVILDGDAHTPAALRTNALVTEAWRAGKWVLGVDLSEAHKEEGLGGRTLLGSKGLSLGYMIRKTTGTHGRPAYQVVDRSLASFQTASASAGRSPGAAKGFAAVVTKKLNERRVAPLSSAGPDNPIPSGLVNWQWLFTWVGDGTTPKATRSGKTQDYGAQINYTVTAFLNNANTSTPFQYMVVQLDGEFNPTAGSGQFAAWNEAEYAWYQDQVMLTLGVDPDLFTWVSNDPQTPNKESTYTASSGFSLGFSDFSKDTLSPVNASYSWGTSTSYSVTNWGVSSNGSGVNMAWNFRSNQPNRDGGYNCISWTAKGGCYYSESLLPRDPVAEWGNELTTGQLQVHASATYRTQSEYSGQTYITNTIGANGDYTVGNYSLVDAYCGRYSPGVCWSDPNPQVYTPTVGGEYWVNLAAVVPPSIQYITFSQGSAPVQQGGTGSVTGTVVLSSPALVDVTVSLGLKSPGANAALADTEATVTIPQGATNGTFKIDTNANGLNQSNPTTVVQVAAYNGTGKGLGVQLPITLKTYAPTDLLPPTTAPGYDNGDWYENAPQGSRWVVGYQVRYAVSFVDAAGNKTDLGPWTDWFSGNYTDGNGNPQAFVQPALTGIATDPTGKAVARNVYRQFLADYSNTDFSAGVTKVITLSDNTTTSAPDTNTPQ